VHGDLGSVDASNWRPLNTLHAARRSDAQWTTVLSGLKCRDFSLTHNVIAMCENLRSVGAGRLVAKGVTVIATPKLPTPDAQDGPKAPNVTPATLLCEACGYPIEDFVHESAGEPTGNCPECGEPVAASLPRRRTGSAWQNRHVRTFRRRIFRVGLGLVGPWLETNFAALKRPQKLFRSLRIEPKSGTGLLLINLYVAGFLVVDPWVGVLIGDPARGARGSGLVAEFAIKTLMLILETSAVALLLGLLTWIEFQGVRFFARQRGWRLTREGAWQVCCHASVGWILLGLLPLFGMAIMFASTYWLGWAPKGVIDLSGLLGPMVPLIGVQGLVTGVLTLGGAILGLLVFETLVYVGIRQCKFAATIAQSHPTPANENGAAPAA
jgi:hypothetical protein